jgi:hypothetical protein
MPIFKLCFIEPSTVATPHRRQMTLFRAVE